MDNVNFSSEALLSNQGDMTSFRYGNSNIRFRTPKCLKRYTEVKEWDNGYIVVMADYEGMGETEEYIDLLPILKNLYINPETFLKPIKTVKIDYHEEEIKAVAEKAMMIVCGYAFSQTEEGFIRVVYLHSPYHALVMTSEGEVTETNMDDIEISIVQKYWKRNKKLMEQAYA